MRCIRPRLCGRAAFPCGKCRPCLVTKSRVWQHRIILEARSHKSSVFCTLTYGQPRYYEYQEELVPRDVQLWLKRLRKRVGSFRMFSCGEYGDQFGRPHYHAILFGVRACLGGPIDRLNGGWICLCPTCSAVRETWGFGFTSVSPLTPGRAQYIAEYVIKRMSSVGDPRLNGRHPEFLRMSLRPHGIGACVVPDVCAVMKQWPDRYPDVPLVLKNGKSYYPLGRYLRKKVRDELGITTDDMEVREDLVLRLVRLRAQQTGQSVSAVYEEAFPDQTTVAEKGSL